ncbi:MAG: Gldg family protein [Verrucomicrobia bacterium]|jgi:ABC-type uncharacterized transport system involved in gliding motility auxiliary subunit|nr:Gldg family protein [Verrucomicrobiota bacterium]
MKSKGLQTILYSAVGLAAMGLILVAFNVVTGAFKLRLDLTEEKAYTLSPGTRAILKGLESPIKIRFYCTQPAAASRDTVFLTSHARLVEDLLQEFRQAGGGKVIVEKYDPQPDSDAEDSAGLDGIQGQMLPDGERFYLGLAVSQLDQKETIPFLAPNRERQLEYDVARAISRVVQPIRPVIGVMSPLPVWGAPGNPMMMQMGQVGGTPPWGIISELKGDFDVRRLEMDAKSIPDDIRVLVLLHPKEITEEAQFALDQFVLRGGKLIAFLDPYCVVDSRGQNPLMGMSAGSSSNLEKLLRAWGLTFDTTKVVADANFRMQLQGRNGQPVEQLTWLSITPEGMNNEDITTAEIDNVWMPMAGAFTGTPAEGLTQITLMQSTAESQLVEGFMANMAPEEVLKEFKSGDKAQTLALRVQGRFKTAFPDGKPASPDGADTNAAPAAAEWLKESASENAVILVGDADLLFDDFTLRRINSPFGQLAMSMNANLNFAQNCVEQMAGDQNLIQVRSRATLNRPFEVVKRKQAEAERRFQGEIAALEAKAQQAQQRLNEMQAQKGDSSQRFILSPEQEQELSKLRREEAETRSNLRQVRKDLRRDIVGLENRVKWVNVLAMPVLVSAFGLGLALVKKRKTGAR